jgi:hypothetical protein
MTGISSKKGSTKPRKRRFATFFEEFSITKKTRKRILISSGIGIICSFIGGIFEQNDLIFAFFMTPGIIIATGGIGVLSVIAEKKQLRNTIIHLLVLLLGMFFKRMHWAGAGIIITIALLSMALGYLFLGFKILYTNKENKYFRVVGSATAFFLALLSTSMVFKYMHWPGAGILVSASLLPYLIFTLIVLVTLPGSGYLLWDEKLKRLFTRKMLIPWLFFLLFSAFIMLLPKNISRQIFSKDANTEYPFEMTPYEIEQLEGMEPDQ